MAESSRDEILNALYGIEKTSSESVKKSLSWLKQSAKDLFEDKKELKEAAGDKFPKDLNRNFITSKMDVRSIGRMFMYVYDPKTKDKLPYYDTFPLVICVEPTKDGFYGLNLHYVPPFVRTRIIEILRENMTKKGKSEAAQIKMSYAILKNSSRFDMIKPCFKRYLFSHVRSNFLYINPVDWNKAVLLPTEKFKKQTKQNIYRAFNARDLRKVKK